MKYNILINNIIFVVDDIKNEISVDDIYVCKFRKKYVYIIKKFIDFSIYGSHCFVFIVNKSNDYISIEYSADAGECFNLTLYKKGITKSQKFYFDNITFSYTHDWMNTLNK